MAKHRKFSVVCHNVKKDSRDQWIKVLGPTKEFTAAVEEYPDQPGCYHLQCFVEFPNPRNKMSVLNELQNATKRLCVPRPMGEERAWGRVQVDVMRGTMDQGHKYLTNPDKDKPLGDAKRQRTSECECRECGHRFDIKSLLEDKNLCYKCDGEIFDRENPHMVPWHLRQIADIVDYAEAAGYFDTVRRRVVALVDEHKSRWDTFCTLCVSGNHTWDEVQMMTSDTLPTFHSIQWPQVEKYISHPNVREYLKMMIIYYPSVLEKSLKERYLKKYHN